MTTPPKYDTWTSLEEPVNQHRAFMRSHTASIRDAKLVSVSLALSYCIEEANGDVAEGLRVLRQLALEVGEVAIQRGAGVVKAS